MMNALSNEILTNELSMREKYIRNTEVLDKIKEVFLMPKLELVTLQYVADFYEVPVGTIRSRVLVTNKEELVSDGAVELTRKEIIAQLEEETPEGLQIITLKSHAEINVNDKYIFRVGNNKTWFFTKRALLRTGMLLRDSEVAVKVRDALLNIEEVSSLSEDVEHDGMFSILGKAFLENDIDKFNEALNLFKNNKDYEELKKKYDDIMHQIKEYEVANDILSNQLHVAKLEKDRLMEEVKDLRNLTKSLYQDIDTIVISETYREVVMKLIAKVQEFENEVYPQKFYVQLYRELKNHHEIDLTARRVAFNKEHSNLKSKLDYLETIEEWEKALTIAKRMCDERRIKINEILDILNRIPGINKNNEIEPF